MTYGSLQHELNLDATIPFTVTYPLLKTVTTVCQLMPSSRPEPPEFELGK